MVLTTNSGLLKPRMALPFLADKKNSIADLIVAKRAPDESEDSQEQEESGPLAAARDLLAAIEAKDPEAISAALSAHQELSSTDESEE